MKNFLDPLKKTIKLIATSTPLKENVRCIEELSRHYSSSSSSQQSLPNQAEVVICGSGVIALSTAYHLIERGISDIVIIQKYNRTQQEYESVPSDYGSPLFRLKPFQEEAVLRESFALYKSLQEKGFDIGMETTGGLYLAQDRETLIRLRRRRDVLTQTSNLHIKILDPREIQDRFPVLNTEDLVGGAMVEDDVSANLMKIRHALGALSVRGGAKIFTNCDFKKVIVEKGKVAGVETRAGFIKCQYFVNTTGCYVWDIGQKQSPPVRIPVHPVLRHYLKTKPIDGLPKKCPSVTDYDANMFLSKLQDNSIIIGAFEKHAKAVFKDGIPDDDEDVWNDSAADKSDGSANPMAPVWDHFAPILDSAVRRLPLLKDSKMDKFTCEAEPFSPDGVWIIGEAPEIKNYFVGAATCGNPMEVGGGMGSYLAHWISKQKRPAPLIKFDILRFTAAQNCRAFLSDRVAESVAAQHAAIIPYLFAFKTARNIRCSPFFSTLNECGAVNGESVGYERPLYFDPKTPNSRGDIYPPLSYYKPPFFEHVEAEHSACLQSVGVVDTSGYAKFFLSSPQDQVVHYLQKLCSNNVDIPIGNMCPTGMHNDVGGFEVDCVLARFAKNRYFMLCPTVLQNRAPLWLRKFMPSDNSINLVDATSKYAYLQLIGPKSSQLLSELARCDISMPPFRFVEKDLAYAPEVIVTTFTNTAEPGYGICIPNEYALHVYNKLMQIGKDYGVRNVGYYAHRVLRMEKHIGIWGDDIHDDCTPAEVGREGRIDFTKDFIGKEVFLKQKQEGVRKRLTSFRFSVDDEEYSIERDTWPVGGEPIFRNGVFIGQTSSVMYGFRDKVMLLTSFVTNPERNNAGKLGIVTKDYIVDKDAIYHVDVAGKRYKIYPNLTLRLGGLVSRKH